MLKIICASQNPVKIEVAKRAFETVFPGVEIEVFGVKTNSAVADQPFGDDTRRGAENRLQEIRTNYPNGDYWIAQEGGLYNENNAMFSRNWIVVADSGGTIGTSSTPSYYIPTKVAELVRQGHELGTACDIVFGTENIKQKGGAIALVTNNLIGRAEESLQPAIIAICQVLNKDWY